MNTSRSLPSGKTIVAIGNFDGVHRGHQALLQQARTISVARNIPLIALTFDPHPRRYFRPDSAPFLMTRADVKNDMLCTFGADHIETLAFDAALANLSADDFVTQILRDRLHADTIVIGPDFHFGHNRMGNADTLRAAGFDVPHTSLVLDHAGIPLSSTRVRSLLQQGHIETASDILGWEYFVRGTVARGDRRGRTLGFPTANIDMGDILAPAHGVYAAWVTRRTASATRYMAAVNIGHRPMFHTPRVLLEAHLLDFTGDLYGETMDIYPIQKIRDEARFDTIDGLTAQMKKDCDFARKLLGSSPVVLPLSGEG